MHNDYYFTTRFSSSIALGAIQTAFSDIGETTLPLHVCHIFFKRVHMIAGIDPFSLEVEECMDRFIKTCLSDLYQSTKRNLAPNNIVGAEM